MFNTKAKQERRIGIPLFLKPFRSATGKSAIVRRPNKPGQHGARRRRGSSEFGKQLTEKQKVRYTYGVREAQMRIYFKKANKSQTTTGGALISLLEGRLDNAVYRLGLASSRSIGRQLVGHGHIQVNGRRVSAPSAQMHVGDVISIRPNSAKIGVFRDLAEQIKTVETPAWLLLNPETMQGTVKALPENIDTGFDIPLVVDYYSKLVK